MRIGIEINGVLRDTLKKIQEVYQKWYIENPFMEEQTDEKSFERKVFSDVTSLNLMEHLAFENEDDVYNFLYKEYTMEIFGHAGSVEYSGMNDLNELYLDLRDNHDIWIVSDEIGKSKPASLFFLSKFGCLVENYKFYSETTINSLWDTIDCLITANPKLLSEYPQDKTLVKYITSYNSNIKTLHEVDSIKNIKNKILELC